jgi:hypothetical protein
MPPASGRVTYDVDGGLHSVADGHSVSGVVRLWFASAASAATAVMTMPITSIACRW